MNFEIPDCAECKQIGSCCRGGVWVDLEEAKTITKLELKGTFHNLEVDESSPSGFIVSTNFAKEPCSFLCVDGKCAIHKISYDLKPKYCKEFPYQDGKLVNLSVQLCCNLYPSKFTGSEK
jgi:Fe-S-cluster containining protein